MQKEFFPKTLSPVSTDMFRQLRLYSIYGDAPQQGVLLWEQPDEGPDRADAAQLRDAAGAHLHATARPLHPAAKSVAGQLAVSSLHIEGLTMGGLERRLYIITMWFCCLNLIKLWLKTENIFKRFNTVECWVSFPGSLGLLAGPTQHLTNCSFKYLKILCSQSQKKKKRKWSLTRHELQASTSLRTHLILASVLCLFISFHMTFWGFYGINFSHPNSLPRQNITFHGHICETKYRNDMKQCALRALRALSVSRSSLKCALLHPPKPL